MPALQGKHWCFTLNNYVEDDVAHLNGLGDALQLNNIHGLVYGFEVGDSGTKHLQGFISMCKRVTLHALKGLISNRIHGEQARDPPKAWDYCKKDGQYREFGKRPVGKGRRTDLQSVQLAIQGGSSYQDIQDQFFRAFCQYPKAIKTYVERYQEKRTWQPEVIVHWGKTGTGKTRSVYDQSMEAQQDLYWFPGNNWFDGYTGQQWVIFDDFDCSEFKLTYLLKLLDRYPMRVPVKGDFVQWVPRKIFITSNKNPRTEWYANAHDEHRQALLRRITSIIHFDAPMQ